MNDNNKKQKIMKKVIALLAISGMTAFYACSNAEKQEETTTEQTTTEQTTAPADSSAQQSAPADTAHHAEGQH